MATSFGLLGATPASQAPVNFGSYSSGNVATPQAKALNTASNGLGQSKPNIPAANPSVNLNGQSNPNIPAAPTQPATNSASMYGTQGTTTGLLAGGHPALGSQTVTDTAGNTIKQKYVTPSSNTTSSSSFPPTPAPTSSSSTTSPPPVNSAPVINNPAPQSDAAVTAPVTAAPAGGVYQGVLGASLGNLNLQPQISSDYQQAGQNLSDITNQIGLLRESAGKAENVYSTSGEPFPIAMGRAQQLAQSEAAQEQGLGTQQQAATQYLQALQQGTGQELTAQQQATQGLLGAGQLANNLTPSPYGTPQVNPATGQTYSGGQQIGSGSPSGSGSGGAIQSNDPAYASLQQYAGMAANGEGSQIPSAWTSNPVINAQINSMASQVNPSYNPLTTPLNTTTQANTNASIGATNQTAAAATQQAISRIGNVSSNMNSFLQEWGLNTSNSPFFNQPMNSFLSSSQGAGALSTWHLITSDLTAATSQLMSTPGITPTNFSAELQNFDPTNLSPSELNTYLEALKSAGEYQQNSYQTTATSAYGSNAPVNQNSSVQPYIGNQTSSTPPPLPAPLSPTLAQAADAPSPLKMLAGGELELFNGGAGLLQAGLGFIASHL